MIILEVTDASVSFGGVKAIDRVSFSMKQAEVFSIVGPNGAGKTTLFNLLSRIYNLESGSIMFDGIDIGTALPHQIAKLGIARTFQNTRALEHESVLNNLLIGSSIHSTTNLLMNSFS